MVFIIFAKNNILGMGENAEHLDLIFETSWEVCNKVGGIYTVLSTKARIQQKLLKDKTIFIGPDIWSEENPSLSFIESKTLLKEWKKTAVFPSGMTIRIGRWDIPGKPIAILVNYKPLLGFKNQLYAEMWERFKVDSLHAYGDYDESCIFAYAASLVIESYLLSFRGKYQDVIAHFHEWTTGMGLLYVKSHMPCVATIFTTHATSVGRSICGNNKELYDYLSKYDGDQMAMQLNMQSKHSLEKTAAHNADCFTTVSDVTAKECEQLLGIRPAVITPNGFEKGFIPLKKDYDSHREKARDAMIKVASAMFGKEISNDTFIIATSGRNEFRNKGLDIFIDLINKLRNSPQSFDKDILAFIMVPAWVDTPRGELLDAMQHSTGEAISDPIITHNLHNYSSDAIYNRLKYLGLNNLEGDKIKVIYVPCYLNGTDGVFNMTYYDLLSGFDATVFPSYYEPWGYTPLESIAFSTPTITTDLSGFGQWVLNNVSESFQECGVKVVHRTDSNYDRVVEEIKVQITDLIKFSPNEIKRLREVLQKTATKASWENFIKAYQVAYKIALKKNKSCCSVNG